MREQLQARLIELKQEFETGQHKLHELERQEAYLRETLLRISGAIQVLEEMLNAPVSTTNEGLNGDRHKAEPTIVGIQSS